MPSSKTLTLGGINLSGEKLKADTNSNIFTSKSCSKSLSNRVWNNCTA